MHCAFNDIRMIVIPNIIKALMFINLRKKKNGNVLQYSYPENPMDREAWQATVHRVAE